VAFEEKEDSKQQYRKAYEEWQEQLQMLHRVLLDGERPSSPDRLKGLLNREVRAFQRYQSARRELLGLPAEDDEAGWK
jgi:hypothetical protein